MIKASLPPTPEWGTWRAGQVVLVQGVESGTGSAAYGRPWVGTLFDPPRWREDIASFELELAAMHQGRLIRVAFPSCYVRGLTDDAEAAWRLTGEVPAW